MIIFFIPNHINEWNQKNCLCICSLCSSTYTSMLNYSGNYKSELQRCVSDSEKATGVALRDAGFVFVLSAHAETHTVKQTTKMWWSVKQNKCWLCLRKCLHFNQSATHTPSCLQSAALLGQICIFTLCYHLSYTLILSGIQHLCSHFVLYTKKMYSVTAGQLNRLNSC